MTQGTPPSGPATREERLAEQLRANLRRRKAQARALASESGAVPDADAIPDPLAPAQPPR